jgi:hypothetical protein
VRQRDLVTGEHEHSPTLGVNFVGGERKIDEGRSQSTNGVAELVDRGSGDFAGQFQFDPRTGRGCHIVLHPPDQPYCRGPQESVGGER